MHAVPGPRWLLFPLLSVMMGLPSQVCSEADTPPDDARFCQVDNRQQPAGEVGWKSVEHWDPGSPVIAGRRWKGVECY